MRLTVNVKLLPNGEQKQQLLATMERFNEACDMVSEAFACRCFNKFAIQAKLYRRIREEYRLSAQLAVRCISKVVESYQADITNIRERNQRKAPDMPQEELAVHTFRPHSAMVYDQRILSWKGMDKVSITSLDGRLIIPTVVRGKYAPLEMSRVKGQADLIYTDRQFIAYKAMLAGVPLVIIDPRNTGLQCSACGHIDEKNRPTQSDFCRVSCGHSENADLNAAKNIRNRAAIIQPMVVRPAEGSA